MGVLRGLVVLAVTAACGSVASEEDAAVDGDGGADGAPTADARPQADAPPDARPPWEMVTSVGGTILGDWGEVVGNGDLIYFLRGDYPFPDDERIFKSIDVRSGRVTDLTPPGMTNQDFGCGCGYGGTPVVWSNRIYYIGNDNGYYDIAANTWQTAAYPQTNKRGEAATAVVGDRIFLVGGRDYLNTTEAYLPSTNTWIDPGTSLANGPFFITSASAGAVGSDLFIMGGSTASSAGNKMAVYSTTANGWMELANTPFEGWSPDVVQLGGKLYVMGDGLRVYDPANGSWAPGVPFPGPGNHYHLAATSSAVYLVYDGADGVTFQRYAY